MARTWGLRVLGFGLGLMLACGLSLAGPLAANVAVPPSAWLERGQAQYRDGEVDAALTLWQRAAAGYAAQGDRDGQVAALSNVAVAAQRLGQWSIARQALDQALPWLAGVSARRQGQWHHTEGSWQLAIGQPVQAIAAWETAQQRYQTAGDRSGLVRTAINRAQALQQMGLNRQALEVLTAVQPLVIDTEASLQGAWERAQGEVWAALRDSPRAIAAWERARALAPTPAERAAVDLAWGNLLRDEGALQPALARYAQAETGEAAALARLQRFALLVAANRSAAAQQLLPDLENVWEILPPGRLRSQQRVVFAESLLPLNLLPAATQQLTTAIAEAQTRDDRRILSLAWGTLGHLHETGRDLVTAAALTRRALQLAETEQMGDLGYRWQWQLGRLQQQQGDLSGAIAAYRAAVDTLNTLRGDLVAAAPTAQFSFRESVEPVYRELAGLLLRGNPGQAELIQARQVVESLQQAELTNYFRNDCLTAQPVELAQVDPNAMILYPIVLPDRLEVIYQIPGKPLQRFQQAVTTAQLEATVEQLRADLLDPTSQDYLTGSQQLYNWLVRPALAEAQAATLVFVPDGALRNIPFAALHDGRQFLAERFKIAVTPGLELLDTRPLTSQPLGAVAAGLTEGRQGFSPLPNVAAEVDRIRQSLPSRVLVDRGFTTQDLEKAIRDTPFPVVHLATHGQFSSTVENTFLLTWDGRLQIEDLNRLLQLRDRERAIELLILSACQTAVGDKRAALGLAGTAVRAGARSTVASLWSVSDEATAQLMVQLYRNLTESKASRGSALQKAQQALLASETYRHPYYWAPFVLLGNWL
ncbi:MAG: CHAT domain-containing protein [Oscillatoriales cyanobacterium SM2_1_8]|nr:CHAT domain-containing protein [Oscillatoriales cyanobacterium SM2_1_8]